MNECPVPVFGMVDNFIGVIVSVVRPGDVGSGVQLLQRHTGDGHKGHTSIDSTTYIQAGLKHKKYKLCYKKVIKIMISFQFSIFPDMDVAGLSEITQTFSHSLPDCARA